VIAILVLLIIQLVSLSCCTCRVARARHRRRVASSARSGAAALIMVFVSVCLLPNGNPTLKELRISPGIAALVDVSLGGSRFPDPPGRPARAAARALELLGPIA